MTTSARSARSPRAVARRANDHPVIEAGARLGYAASGVLHLALAWLTMQLAIGRGGQEADQTGALRGLAQNAGGQALLWGLLAGFVLLGLWQVTEAVAATGRHRVQPAAKALVYAALAVTTWSTVRGASGSGSQQAEGITAGLMGTTAGVVAVAAAGATILAVGVHHVLKGARATFLRDLREHPGRGVERLGRLGYVAKGLALGVVGGLVVLAAFRHDPQRAGGLDEALRTLLDAPGGPVLVGAVALGFACFGGYSFARARYARV